MKKPAFQIKRLLTTIVHWNWLVILAVGVLASLILILVLFFTYGHRIDREYVAGLPEYVDSDHDVMCLPIIPEGAVVPQDDGATTIVAFGNAPFADDKDSPDSLSSIIASKTDVTIYNCAVKDSYLSTANFTFNAQDYAMDAWSFYWMACLITFGTNDWMYQEAFAYLGENTPADARESYETLRSIDFMDVDVITILYDGSDYLEGRSVYTDGNTTDIQTFTGNLAAGIEIIRSVYPHIRIIVLSTPYAYAIDEDGSYVSSDIKRYGKDSLSTYMIKVSDLCYNENITHVDLLYEAFHEENATEYLKDNLHLNVDGRNAIADRFIFALNYFD
ncbi:MAG: SGNH/GDSL hydrolase family protein [Clostridium sp.]|jgi:lysophospholipase L1-like esterase|nr:SGNH/GDSL hydrolase family protein [Clostridium sp.]